MDKLAATMAGRSWALMVGGAAGAFLIATIGVSAHTGAITLFQPAGVHQSDANASGARSEAKESPEPTEASESKVEPEASPSARPTEKPETPDGDDSTDSTTGDD